MLEAWMWPRELEVIGLGPLKRRWRFWLHDKWHGHIGDVALRVPGGYEAPDLEATETAKRVLARLQTDMAPVLAALEATLAESEPISSLPGEPRWRALDVWPYGQRPGGAMAIFEVPWDEEHAWGVWLDDSGSVKEVVVSP